MGSKTQSGRLVANGLLAQINKVNGYLPSRQMLDTVFEPFIIMRLEDWALLSRDTYMVPHDIASPPGPRKFAGLDVVLAVDAGAPTLAFKLKAPVHER